MSDSESELEEQADAIDCDYLEKFFPRFEVPLDHPSQCVCLNCDGKISPERERVYCTCKCSVYCSDECKRQDDDRNWHSVTCSRVDQKCLEIQERCEQMQPHSESYFHRIVTGDLRGNLFEYGKSQTCRRFDPVLLKKYFKAREELIVLLINEACNTHYCEKDRNTNTLALEIALLQCQDMLQLDEFDCSYSREDGLNPKREYLFSLYLFTGRFDELYSDCCVYAQTGEHHGHLVGPGYKILCHRKEVERDSITEPFFYAHSLHHRHFPHLSLSYVFILKYVLHMNMENLRLLRENGLDNDDCLQLIGEYVGMKRAWFHCEKNWYLDQAHEVLESFHRSQASEHFGILHGCSEVFLSSGQFNQISVALKVGRERLSQPRTISQPRKPVSTEWVSDVNEQEEELKELYPLFNIEPIFATAVKQLNSIAGYPALSRNFAQFSTATQFVTEAMKICENGSFSFEEFLDNMDAEFGHPSHLSWNILPYHYWEEPFSYGLLECLVAERRLAQSYFYRNHIIDVVEDKAGNEKFLAAHAALEKLPQELSPYTFGRPQQLPDDDPFLNFPVRGMEKSDPGILAKIELVSTWLPDVTNVVDALFHADLATEENLSAIFGKSSLVSNRIWELEKATLPKKHRDIASYFTKTKPWKAGCIRYESSSGLKLQYLTRTARTKKFEEMDNRRLMDHLEPSLGQFCEKFGWDNLGIQSDRSLFSFPQSNQWDSIQYIVLGIAKAKRRRRGLDGFESVEDACRLYFDTSSLEEAIFDFLQIPRVRIVNGTAETMANSSWRKLGKDCFLGDKAVTIGSRIALDCSGNWWSEK